MNDTEKSIQALEKTNEALQQIRIKLQPFLERYDLSSSAKRPKTAAQRQQRALHQAAVALSLGTLRYMGARLQGLDKGRRSDDPLRQELNQMRKLLVSLQEKAKKGSKKTKAAAAVQQTKAEASKKNQRVGDKNSKPTSAPLSGSKRKAAHADDSSSKRLKTTNQK